MVVPSSTFNIPSANQSVAIFYLELVIPVQVGDHLALMSTAISPDKMLMWTLKVNIDFYGNHYIVLSPYCSAKSNDNEVISIQVTARG